MATNASIAIQHESGMISEIHCYYDGYPDSVGRLLKEHYNTPEKIAALIALGDISVLAPSIECPAGHTFKTPVRGYTVAYHRDRGEGKKPNVTTHSNFVAYKRAAATRCEYNYLFVDNGWIVWQ